MRRLEVKAERTINGNTFYVRPFPAFVAANLSGELFSLAAPVLASLSAIVPGDGNPEGASLLDVDAAAAAPALASGLGSLSGDKLESLLKKLLTKHGNVSVELADGSGLQALTNDVADEAFCGDAQDMFILAFEVIKVNYSGFFRNLGGQFGNLLNSVLKG